MAYEEGWSLICSCVLEVGFAQSRVEFTSDEDTYKSLFNKVVLSVEYFFLIFY